MKSKESCGRPLRIALLSSSRFWRGANDVFAALARGLADRGHTTTAVVAYEAVARGFRERNLSVRLLPVRGRKARSRGKSAGPGPTSASAEWARWIVSSVLVGSTRRHESVSRFARSRRKACHSSAAMSGGVSWANSSQTRISPGAVFAPQIRKKSQNNPRAAARARRVRPAVAAALTFGTM